MVSWYFSYLTGHSSVYFIAISYFSNLETLALFRAKSLFEFILCVIFISLVGFDIIYHSWLLYVYFQFTPLPWAPDLYSQVLIPHLHLHVQESSWNCKSTFWFLSQNFCFFILASASGTSILLVAQTKKLWIILIIHPIYEKCTLRNMSRT